jgi:hypothetical protein
MASVVMDLIARNQFSAVYQKAITDNKTLAKQVETTNATMGKMARDVKSKVTGVLAGAFAAGGIISFGKTSIDTFSQVAGESLKLQRVMGGTVKSASEWRGAMQLGGISNDQFMASVRALSKQIVAAGGGKASAFDKLGLAVRDVHGQMKPMNDLLPLIADRFKIMAPGAEKNAIAIQLFGRNGLAMLPFLNRGAAGMEDLRKKANELGITIGDKQAEAFKRNVAAQRTMQAAIQGLQIWVGERLIPAMTAFANFMSQRVVPGIKVVAAVIGDVIGVISGWIDWLNKNRTALILIAGTVAAFVIPTLIRMGIQWTVLGVQSLLAAAKVAAAWIISMGPIAIVTAAVIGLVILIIRNWNTIKNVTTAVWDFVFGFIRDHWKLIVAVITGPLGALVIFIITHWNQIKTTIVNAMQAVLDFLKGIPGKIAGFFSGALNLLVNAGKNIITGLWNGIVGLSTWLAGNLARIPGWITGALRNAGTWLLGIGADIIRGLWEGIKSLGSWIIDKVLSIIPGWIKTALGLSSPPKWAIQFGTWIAEGLAKGITKFPGFIANLGKAALKKVAELAKSVGGGFVPSGPVPASVQAEQEYAARLFPAHGWNVLSELQALKTLWTNESGWNPGATNPSSGAYGIPQAWPASKLDSYGNRNSPAVQIQWGLDYIQQAYGTPSAALSAWLGRSPHWYQAGAWNIARDELAYLHRGEMVVPEPTARQVRAGSGMSAGAIAAAVADALSGATFRFDGDGLARLVTKKQTAYAVRGGRR